MNRLRRAAKALIGNRWVVRRTIWPYPDGWGTYNPYTKAVLDTGLSREEAQKRADTLNREAS